jgi:phosphopantothenoylcysteine decarboxylase/phosphopantothenate--cysteine ligase
MASLTVRQLDDTLKKLLRLRAARNGRSMEDEIRVILRAAADQAGGEILEQFEPPSRPQRKQAATVVTNDKRILLINRSI